MPEKQTWMLLNSLQESIKANKAVIDEAKSVIAKVVR